MSSDLKSSESVEDNILKCIFCFGEVADSVLLNCLHSACRTCIEDDVNARVTCPTCHVTTDISTWKTNLLVSSRGHRSRVLKDVFSCTPCSDDGEKDTSAVVWCHTCQYSLCVDCQTRQSRFHSTHKCMPLCEKTNLSELYLPPAHSCPKHDKKLEFACFTCKDVRCNMCAHDCYKLLHEVLPLDGPDALRRIKNSGTQVAAALSELKSEVTLMQPHVNLPEKVASAQQESLAILETAKKAAVDSISNAYQKSETSLLDCWESLAVKSQGVQKSAEVLKNRVHWTDTYCKMAVNSNDMCGLLPQLDVVFAALRDLQEEARQLKEQIDPKMLVRYHVCLPGDLDLITAGWFGTANVVSDDFSCSVDTVPSEDCDDYYTTKVATLKELEQLTQKQKKQQKRLTLQLEALELLELTREQVLVATQNEKKKLLDQQKEQQEQLERERRTVEQLQVELNSKTQQLGSIMNYAGIGWLHLSICLLAIFIQLPREQVVGYEAAFRSAVNRTTGIADPATRIVSEMQAFSEYLSPAYSGFEAFPVYTGCQDAYIKGSRESGVFVISRSGSPPFRAWCDFDNTGGWMVIQRRVDGTVDFFRRWADYEPGFGNLWGEYWLGLDKMHLMTPSDVALSVYMEAFDGVSAWANYTAFSIGDAASQYTLTASGFSGSAGDSLSSHNGKQFSTWDRDNDPHRRGCAQLYTGSWWYHNGYKSNLNGRYDRLSTTSSTSSNCWQAFKGNYGLKVSILRILA